MSFGFPRTWAISPPSRREWPSPAAHAGSSPTPICRTISTPSQPLVELLTNEGFHIVVGDRTLAESEPGADRRSAAAPISTRVFSFSVRMLVTGELFDTQVGFKAFRGDVASALFPLITDDGFAGDVELLYVALKYNLAIRRIPVRLLRTGPSTVSVVGHSLPMLRESRASAAVGRPASTNPRLCAALRASVTGRQSRSP